MTIQEINDILVESYASTGDRRSKAIQKFPSIMSDLRGLRRVRVDLFARVKELELRCDETVKEFDNISQGDLLAEFEHLSDQLMSIGMTNKEGK